MITTSSGGKIKACKEMGADYTVDRVTNPAFGEAVREATGGKGADIILDCVGGGGYAAENVKAVGLDGTWVLYGLLGGRTGEGLTDNLFGCVLSKRVTLRGTTLRGRGPEYKAKLTREFTRDVVPLLGVEGGYRVLVDKGFLLEEMQKAHNLMDRNGNVGKIIVRVFGCAEDQELEELLEAEREFSEVSAKGLDAGFGTYAIMAGEELNTMGGQISSLGLEEEEVGEGAQ